MNEWLMIELRPDDPCLVRNFDDAGDSRGGWIDAKPAMGVSC